MMTAAVTVITDKKNDKSVIKGILHEQIEAANVHYGYLARQRSVHIHINSSTHYAIIASLLMNLFNYDSPLRERQCAVITTHSAPNDNIGRGCLNETREMKSLFQPRMDCLLETGETLIVALHHRKKKALRGKKRENWSRLGDETEMRCHCTECGVGLMSCSDWLRQMVNTQAHGRMRRVNDV